MNYDTIKKKRGRPKKEHLREIDNSDFSLSQSQTYQLPKHLDPEESEFRIKKKLKRAKGEEITLNPPPELPKSPPKLIIKPQQQPLWRSFQEIVQSSRNNDFQIMLSNILTTGSRQLNEKRILLKKKRSNLQGSNLSQQEYMKREKELIKSENEETLEVKENILSRLATSKIKGFETKEQLIEILKKNIDNPNNLEIEIDENEFGEYKKSQMLLLDKLLEERSFVNPDLKISMNMGKFKGHDGQNIEFQEKNKTNELNLEIKEKKEDEKKKIMLYKILEEGEISEKDGLNDKLKTSFQNLDEFIKISNEDCFPMNKYEKMNLLEQKSDYLYIDEKFQKYQYEKFSKLMREIEGKNEELKNLDDQTIFELTKLTTYILNNVHYFHKFKLESEFVNPYDLLYILEKTKLN